MLCSICMINKATEQHHLYSQTKLAKKLYPEYIHQPKNLLELCSPCHLNQSIPKLTELQFCELFGIIPRSKSGLFKYHRGVE